MTNVRGRFTWFEWARFGMGDLLRLCPQAVVGKYVAISAFDSGPLRLSKKEIASGWIQLGELAISPRIADVAILPYEQYDEWFVLEQPREFAVPARFASYGQFTLRDPSFLAEGADPTWDRKAIEADQERLAALQDAFWRCLEGSGATSYFGDGDRFVAVTSDGALAAVLARHRSA